MGGEKKSSGTGATIIPPGTREAGGRRLRVDQDLCVGCGQCLPYCPMQAIHLEGDLALIDEDECVECHICTHARVCPTDALVDSPQEEGRVLRQVFSDPLVSHKGTNVPGRGTEEMKTNDVTGRFKHGEAGVAVELGRPGTGTRFVDVEKVAMVCAKAGARFEPQNPVTSLMTDPSTGQLRRDVLNEKVLSAIVEFSVPLDQLPSLLNNLREVAGQVDTVFSVDLVSRLGPDGKNPAAALAEAAGFRLSPNGKLNVGLGRPRAKEVSK